jgi:putative sigma-54 modulation protein
MNTDVHARGFTLTEALRAAVEREAADLHRRLPERIGAVSVRLFDANGTRGGADKGCLVHLRLAGSGAAVVASHLDADLYAAIARAFAKLHRGARGALERRRAPRRGLAPRMATVPASRGDAAARSALQESS